MSNTNPSTVLSQDTNFPIPPPTSVPKPSIVGYEVEAELGRGGMGVVYKATQLGLNRVVAIKMILAGVCADDADRKRFQREAEAVAALNHPNIVQIHQVGEHQGLPFATLEYCPEGSLMDRLDGTPWQPDAAARFIKTLAEAVQFAHQKQLIHRDLKPANILMSGDVPKVSDFGLVRRMDGPGHTGESGTIAGSPAYMAPEQAAGETNLMGPGTDVYALGVILYELLSGRPPLKAASAQGTIQLVLHQEPVPLRRLQPNIPKDLETISLKCLQKEPKRRYTSARELADDLGRFLSGEPILARPVGVTERTWRWCKRNPSIAGSLTALVLVLLTATVISTLFAFSERRARRDEETAKTQAREDADHAVQTSRDLLQTTLIVVRDLQGLLTSLPRVRSSRSDWLVIALENLRKIGRKLPEDATLGEATILVHGQIGDIFLTVGRQPTRADAGDGPQHESWTSEAAWHYAEAHRLAIQRQERYPAPDSTFDLACCEQRLGRLELVRGKIEKARVHFVRAFELCSEVEKEVSAEKKIETIYSTASIRVALGEIEIKEGKAKSAREQFLKAGELHQRVIDAEPDNLRNHHALLIALAQLGDAELVLGDGDAALVAYKRALDIAAHIEKNEPHNPQVMRDLGVLQAKLGDLQLKEGKNADALLHYRKALTIHERLVELDPHNASLQRDRWTAYSKVGDVELQSKNYTDAGEAYRLGLAMCEKALLTNSDNNEYQRDRAFFYSKLGDIELRTGHTDTAEIMYKTSLDARKKLAAIDRRNLEAIREEILIRSKHGGFAEKRGDHAQAREAYEGVLRDRLELAKGNPLDFPTLIEIVHTHVKLGACCQQEIDYPAAVRHYEQASAILETMKKQGYRLPFPLLSLMKQIAEWLQVGRAGEQSLRDLDSLARQPVHIAEYVFHDRIAFHARHGRLSEAVHEIVEMVRLIGEDSGVYVEAACGYALCRTAVVRGKPPGECTVFERALQEYYAILAVEMLREALQRGFKDLGHIQREPDLAGLRDRRDFRELMKR